MSSFRRPAMRSVERQPEDAALLVARATTLYESGRVIEARDTLIRAHALGGRSAELSLNLGWCCAATGMLRESVQWMASAVAANPDSIEERFGLATALLGVGLGGDAQKQLEFVLAREPLHFQSLVQLGEHKLATNEVEAAETLFRRAIAAEPRNPIGWLTLNSALDRQGRSGEAAEAVETAQRLEQETGIDVENFLNLAIVRGDAGRFDEARAILEANLPDKPSPAAHLAYAFLLLRAGSFPEGWEHYEFRLMQPNRMAGRPRYGKPPWTGQRLQGRTILLRRDQGVGDAIQFVRYAPMLKALGATVWLQIGAALRGLAQGFDGVDRVFGEDDAVPDFAFYVHLPSLPRLFATELATIPSHVPYVSASEPHLAKWKRRLGEVSGCKVGLAWAGDPHHLRDRERSIALKTLMPLGEVEGVRLFSLQKGNASTELASLHKFPVEDLSSELNDFSDTAAAIQQMDLIISVDTAVAHLAGAMAKPAWLLLQTPSDFRWLSDRDDSPWYPTMRLFRQTRRGDWSEVVERVTAALRSSVEGRDVTPRRLDASRPVSVSSTSALQRATPWEPARMPAPHSAIAETRFGIVHYWPEEPLVGDSLRWYGECLQPVVDGLISLIRHGATIVETEAGVGYHSLALAAAVGSSGHLIAYEHRPLHRRVLCQNVAANGARNVTIMRRSTVASTASGDDGNAPETIDQLALERIDLLKINMATHVPQLLAGAIQTIWRHRPLLFMSGFRATTAREILVSARDFGYRFFRCDVPLFNAPNFNHREENVFAGLPPEVTILAAPEERSGFVPPAGYRDIS